MIYSIDVRIEAPVNETEVTDRVGDAIGNLFPMADVRSEPGRLVAETHSLDAFSDVLYDQQILDTARREFFKRATEDGFSFSLKKQAAFQGVVNFSVGNPDELGDIDVTVAVREPDVDTLIDHIAPPTEDGTPIDPDRRSD
ncbi:MAG: RNA-binding domain-containing protein [Halobacteriota archaeon]